MTRAEWEQLWNLLCRAFETERKANRYEAFKVLYNAARIAADRLEE